MIATGLTTKRNPASRRFILACIASLLALPLSVRAETNATVSTIYSFTGSSDGAYPDGALAVGPDGNFYGVTSYGGMTSDGPGTVFKLTPTGTLTTLHRFNDGDGAYPTGGLALGSDGNFYGVTSFGGDHEAGTVYRITPDGVFTSLYSFTGGDNGSQPGGPLLQGSDGNLYGTTFQGGPTNDGTVFKMTPTGILTTLHTFTSSVDGTAPVPGLVQTADGSLYGVTPGNNDKASGATVPAGDPVYGTVYRISPDGIFTTAHVFAGEYDGARPRGALLLARDGSLFGTTTTASSDFNPDLAGTIFKLTADGVFFNFYIFRHSTQAAQGISPHGKLLQAADGNLYGTSSGGATANTVSKYFSYPIGGGLLTALYSDSNNHPGSLVQGADGALYGPAFGSANSGLIVKLTLPTAAPPPVATLTATVPAVTAGSGDIGQFTVSLSSAVPTTSTVINFTIKGTAINGTDYVLLKTTKKIKAGNKSKPIKIIPLGNLGGADKKVVTLVLAPGDGYTVGTTGKVKVKLLAPGN